MLTPARDREPRTEEDTVAGTTQQGKGQTSDPNGKGQTANPGKRRVKPAGAGRRPVDDKTRARIAQLIGEGELSRNAIAKACHVSPSTVSRFAPAGSFDRSATAVAVQARTQDLKALRAVEALASIELATKLRGLMFEERTVRTTDGQGTVVEYQLEPSARDWKDTMTAYGIALDKHLVLVRHDSDDRDLPAVDKWLEAMGVGVAHALS